MHSPMNRVKFALILLSLIFIILLIKLNHSMSCI
jgi:hypothetical protein